MERMKQLN